LRSILADDNTHYANSNEVCDMLMLTRPTFDVIIKLLLAAGADANAASNKFRTKTVISFLPSASYLGKVTIFCIDSLLDQFSKSQRINPIILQEVILHGGIDFVPKLIQCGLFPAEIRARKVILGRHAFQQDEEMFVSPLCLALLAGKIELAIYFIENVFLVKSDISKTY
jgi:hypothetical protein